MWTFSNDIATKYHVLGTEPLSLVSVSTKIGSFLRFSVLKLRFSTTRAQKPSIWVWRNFVEVAVTRDEIFAISVLPNTGGNLEMTCDIGASGRNPLLFVTDHVQWHSESICFRALYAQGYSETGRPSPAPRAAWPDCLCWWSILDGPCRGLPP